MTTISALSVLASKGELAPRLDTMLLRYPRCIHAEFMTHRVFARNAASSRAIPVKKLIASVMEDPFVPLHWGKNQKGMQAYAQCQELVSCMTDTGGCEDLPNEKAWLLARDRVVKIAEAFDEAGYHKQIVNRLLEPWMHITVLCTATQWTNFFALRDHEHAEPHIQLLAREMKWAYQTAAVQELAVGEWHLPMAHMPDDEQQAAATAMMCDLNNEDRNKLTQNLLIKLSVARCASTSYKTVDGFDMTMDRAITLHDDFVKNRPLHASPMEHQAKVDEGRKVGYPDDFYVKWSRPGMGGNLGDGWIQYRKTLPNECL